MEHQDETPWQSMVASLVEEVPNEVLGRSRGGFTTNLHLSADGRCRPLSLAVTGGQWADCTQFKPVGPEPSYQFLHRDRELR